MDKKVYSLDILCPDFESAEIVSELFLDLGYGNGIRNEDSKFTAQIFMHDKPPHDELMSKIRALESIWGDNQFKVSFNDLSNEDWTIKNQISEKPYTAGKFFVYQNVYKGKIPNDKIPLIVNPANAFGIGSHPTTMGCLTAISELPHTQYDNIIDVGTGTGVLAVGMAKYIKHKTITASDIDENSITATKQTMTDNNVADIDVICANGLSDKNIKNKKYDLIVANILANVLIDIAGDISTILNTNGTVILSGIDTKSLERVVDCYNNLGFVLKSQYENDNWHTLVMEND